MLVLSRKLNESVVIGDDITITVINVGPDKVRFTFEAPKHISIFRREVLSRIGNGQLPSAPCTKSSSISRSGRWDSTALDWNAPPFAEWRVLFTTPVATHPFVIRVLKEIMDRYPGMASGTEYHPNEHILEVIPPRGTPIGESDRIGVEIEALQGEIHRAMEREADDDVFQDHAI
jgi:carbon storage regulator